MSSNNSDLAIKVEDVSKLFYKQNQNTFKELLEALVLRKKTHDNFYALKNINFEVKKGETLGIIGPNGSGKSTLLKLIAGVTQPSEGKITVNGKIAPLIELGAGFHPELTGRENIYLNATILGLKKDEIQSKEKEIIDFAELHEFIDQPVKHYSSGMFLRLAFSVAIQTNPDILLVDEILAVGDERFQQKCFEKMVELLKQGISMIFVSHDLYSMRKFCNQTMYLNKGRIIEYGETEKVIRKYTKTTFEEEIDEDTNSEKKPNNDSKNDRIVFHKVELFDQNGKKKKRFFSSETVKIVIHYKAQKSYPKADIGISINADGKYLYGTSSSSQFKSQDLKKEGKINFHLPKIPILEGIIQITLAIKNRKGKMIIWKDNIIKIPIIKAHQKAIGIVDFNIDL